MSGVRNWAVGSAVAALILASPVVALLAVIVAEMPIDLLMNFMALTLLSLTMISAVGWLALHRPSASPMERLSLKTLPSRERQRQLRPLM
jgi:hypothetical protein